MSVAAVEKGPLPPGLDEQVDLFWKVRSRRPASDAFGRRVSELFFAVELMVGNNTGYDLQITSVGFTLKQDKDSLGPEEYLAPLPNDSYAGVRDVVERERQVGARAIFFNALNGLGPILTGVTPLLGAAARDDYTASIAMHGPLALGLDRVFPDRTIRHLVSLDNQTLRDSVIVPNNISQRLLVFVSRELVMCPRPGVIRRREIDCKDGRQPWSQDFDPKQIMAKLGRMVVVGKKIEYLNRVRVVSTPEPVVSPPPVVQPTGEMKIAQGTTGKVFTLQGANLRGAAVASESGVPLISEVTPGPRGTVVSFKATTQYDARPGKYKLYVNTSSGREVLEMEVTGEPPKPTDVKGLEQPPKQSDADKSLSVILTGSFLKDAKAALGDGEKGIRIESVQAAGDEKDENKDQTLTISLTILKEAEPKKYHLHLTRPGGSKTLDFELQPAKPTVQPASKTVKKGTDPSPASLEIVGTFLQYASVEAPATSGLKLTLKAAAPAKLTVSVDFSSAKPGVHKLTVKNGAETAAEGIEFKVE